MHPLRLIPLAHLNWKLYTENQLSSVAIGTSQIPPPPSPPYSTSTTMVPCSLQLYSTMHSCWCLPSICTCSYADILLLVDISRGGYCLGNCCQNSEVVQRDCPAKYYSFLMWLLLCPRGVFLFVFCWAAVSFFCESAIYTTCNYSLNFCADCNMQRGRIVSIWHVTSAKCCLNIPHSQFCCQVICLDGPPNEQKCCFSIDFVWILISCCPRGKWIW